MYSSYSFNTFTTSEKRTTSLSIKDKTSEFILSPTYPLCGGSPVYVNDLPNRISHSEQDGPFCIHYLGSQDGTKHIINLSWSDQIA